MNLAHHMYYNPLLDPLYNNGLAESNGVVQALFLLLHVRRGTTRGD